MDLSTAVLWWEEWQLRILVLGSLFLQWLLFLSASLRKFAIPSWFRFIIWLAYNGSDTLVLYALATLFTRQRRQDCSSGQGNSILEVVWAPVLLMHLGGQDLITAYNIEDNELWTRHVIAAVSQITIAIYVFCKSWPGGDMWLLFAALLFFIPGILKCIEKPWALKCASINSLVSSSGPAPRRNTDRDGRISSLEDYMQKASAFARINPRCRAQEGDAVDLEADNHLPQAQREEDAVDLEADNHLPQAQREEDAVDLEADHQPRVHGEVAVGDLQPDHHPQTSSKWVGRLRQIQEKLIGELYQQRENKRSRLNGYKVDREAYKLFLDLASPYPDRLGILKSIWVLDEKQASVLLQNRLFGAFDLLYTKRKMVRVWDEGRKEDPSVLKYLSFSVRGSAGYLPWVAIGLFHKSHRQAYNADDVKVTYAMFCCTAVLDFLNIMISLEDINSDSIERQYYTRALTQQAITKAITKAMQWLRVKKLVALCEQGKATSFQWLRTIQPKWAKKFDFMINAGLLDDILRRAVSDKVLINSFLGQYNLVGFFSRNKRHSKKMCIVNLLNCKDFLDQHWSMKPCKSSFAVTELVLKYVKKGWEDHIEDVASYWKFSDRRGQWTLQSNNCDPDLSCSLRKPFDESVLLWHIATDFCFYYMGASADHQCATAQCIQDASGQGHGCAVWCERSPHHKRAVQCREISNYMMYLLFVNPEMLLPGTRRNLFTAANSELKKILKDDNPSLKKILKGDKPSLMEILKCNKPFCKFFTVKRPSLKEIERGFTQRIIARVQPTENREQVVEHTELPLDAETDATAQEGFVHDAWNLANGLLQMRDEKKMWEVIEGVWVEMLCFSASRCRGYLHAKSLGTGPELLTYVWLLLSHMGMETLPERLQRTEFSCGEGNASATPSTSQIEIGYPARFRGLRPHEESATSAAGTSTSGSQEIVPAE